MKLSIYVIILLIIPMTFAWWFPQAPPPIISKVNFSSFIPQPPYLYNQSLNLFLNESYLNYTILSLIGNITHGINGLNGTHGTNGTNGTNGINGLNGTNGINGLNGTDGTDGSNGLNGLNLTIINITANLNGTYIWYFSDGFNYTTLRLNGLNGLNGTNGINGLNGTNGTNGLNGLNGTNGINGLNGTNGTNGLNGLNGTNGINGLNGTNGNNGLNGSAISGNKPYLYNSTTIMYFNESKLNQTIRYIALTKSYEYNMNVSVVAGSGSATTANNIKYLITEIIVTPPSIPVNYRFDLSKSATNSVIDRNLIVHHDVWDIQKSYSLNDTIIANITAANVDGEYMIKIKYINNNI